MKTCSRCKEVKTDDQFHKRANRASGLVPHCKSCKTVMAAEYATRNRDAINARSLAYFYSNAERLRARAREWHGSNPERSKELQQRWSNSNKDHRAAEFKKWAAENRQRIRENSKRAYQNNPATFIARSGKQRALRRRAVPAWCDLSAITYIYKEARRLSETTGTKYVVDHVVPLRSKLVCGLHVKENLAVVPHAYNAKKSNRYWPDMAEL